MDPITGTILISTAATLALLHTAIGVDHSVPFFVVGRARGWSLRRTLGVTAVCGVGHVGASVIIGYIGIALGVAVEQIAWVDGARGNIAAWSLVAIGVAYACFGLIRGRRGRGHGHDVHSHAEGTVASGSRSGASWVLFVVFLLGPCEALVPLMMAAHITQGAGTVLALILVFGLLTVATMVATVAFGFLGMRVLGSRLHWMDRHLDLLAGSAVAASGGAVLLLGI